MKKQLKIFFMAVFIILVNAANSQPITSATAVKVATNFYYERAFNHNPNTKYQDIKLKNVFTEKQGSHLVYYVFNADSNKGWIMVAAQQNVTPVLAYALSGNYDTVKANQPPAFQFWMNNYKSQVVYAIKNSLAPDTAISNKWTYYKAYSPTKGGGPKNINTVSPLLQTTWAQSCYYNAMCPYDATSITCSGSSSPSTPPCDHVWVGCVATAMAQVMKYWSYPGSGTGSHTDSYTNYGTLSANFGATTYNWANMPNNVTSANSDVATLDYQCGVAVNMNYGECGSSAYTNDAATAFLSYFKFATASYKNKSSGSYSDAAWSALLVADLNNNFPVIMGGQDPVAGDGHEWVCDGYDTPTDFHMNWGWGWSGGGNYCTVSAIIPNSTPPQPNYTSAQDAIFNLSPPCGTTLTGANTSGIFEDRCAIYLLPNFSTLAGGTFHAKIIP